MLCTHVTVPSACVWRSENNCGSQALSPGLYIVNTGCATELDRIACTECFNGSLNYSSRATPGIRWNYLHFSAEETEAFPLQSVVEEREF